MVTRTSKPSLCCYWRRSVQGTLGMAWVLDKLCERKRILSASNGERLTTVMPTEMDENEWEQYLKDICVKEKDDSQTDYRLGRINKKQVEKDPNGIDLKTPGSKADANKPAVLQGVLQYFPRALLAVGEVSTLGAQKYSWRGWESVPNGINRYGDALGRHLLAEAIEGPYDRDTGALHRAQVAWNALASLELILREKEELTPEKCRSVTKALWPATKEFFNKVYPDDNKK